MKVTSTKKINYFQSIGFNNKFNNIIDQDNENDV